MRRTAFRSLTESIANQGIVQKEQRPWTEQATGEQAIPYSLERNKNVNRTKQ
jgi:hypothetical protein